MAAKQPARKTSTPRVIHRATAQTRITERAAHRPAQRINISFSKPELFMIVAMLAVGALVIFNQYQLSDLSKNYGKLSGHKAKSLSFDGSDISKIDISEIKSTPQAVAALFPELDGVGSQEDAVEVMLPTGTPEYSDAFSDIGVELSFENAVPSMEALARYFPTIKEEVKQNDPEAWNRYLELAAKPHGISCEFCCGIGSQGADENGESRCGCQHNPALLALTLGLVSRTELTDAEVLKEVMRWKTLFFPKNMIETALNVAGEDPSSIQELPGMVGGC